MKKNILLVLLFFLIPIIINGQAQVATTSFGKKVILNADAHGNMLKKPQHQRVKSNSKC